MSEIVKQWGDLIILLSVIFITVLVISIITNNPSVTSIYDEEVVVTVIDAHHRPATVINGIATPAKSYIDITHNGASYTVYGYDTYITYKERLGEDVTAILRTTTLKNGGRKQEILIN